MTTIENAAETFRAQINDDHNRVPIEDILGHFDSHELECWEQVFNTTRDFSAAFTGATLGIDNVDLIGSADDISEWNSPTEFMRDQCDICRDQVFWIQAGGEMSWVNEMGQPRSISPVEETPLEGASGAVCDDCVDNITDGDANETFAVFSPDEGPSRMYLSDEVRYVEDGVSDYEHVLEALKERNEDVLDEWAIFTPWKDEFDDEHDVPTRNVHPEKRERFEEIRDATDYYHDFVTLVFDGDLVVDEIDEDEGVIEQSDERHVQLVLVPEAESEIANNWFDLF